jgi:hypothetical protein
MENKISLKKVLFVLSCFFVMGIVDLIGSTPENQFDVTDVRCKKDGVSVVVLAGGKVVLAPGESITLEQGMYHRFCGEEGKGMEEALRLSGQTTVEGAFSFFKSTGIGAVIVTHGANPLCYFCNNELLDAPTFFVWLTLLFVRFVHPIPRHCRWTGL